MEIYTSMLDNINEGIILIDESLSIRFWNKYMANTTDLSRKDVEGKYIYEILPRFKETIFLKTFRTMIRENQKHFFSAALHKNFVYDKNYGDHNLRQNLKVSTISIDKKNYILMEIIDVTGEYIRVEGYKDYIKKFRDIERSLNKSELKYKILFENMIKGFLYTKIVKDDNGDIKDLLILDVNKAFLNFFKIEKEDVLHKELFTKLKHLVCKRSFIDEIKKHALEGDTLKIDEMHIPKLDKTIEILGYKMGKDSYALIFDDITEKKNNEKAIINLAYYDQLTNLYNRKIFMERVEKEILGARSNKSKCALIMLDLDKFKDINDTYGHYYGDEVLKISSKRIKNIIRKGDFAGRYGGDELLIFISNIKKESNIEIIARRIIRSLKIPIDVEGVVICPSASLGISIYPNDGSNVDDLLRVADKNLYKAKVKRGGYCFR
ncbi:MAG: sensor domain-containing diguanylate cyclase [Clostridiaceae bacterium]|nr:sensor domain-containing diguanylate cyclase [Clostridiaceae bacterium]MBW4859203.1 sensor domain-containing diguanylate cyclase [Clostridiaceae bacterium]MBW4868699.1 sensor domain-containing diguanylate cyclase [Clostridiaceae bacterium]